MIYATLQYGYQATLAALLGVISFEGTAPMRRTILTIFAVMLASFGLSSLWPTPAYSMAMIVVDALACAIITRHPSGKWQAVVGLSYILQIGVHVGRLAANNPDINSFWWGLTGLALLQLVLVGGWWANDVLGISIRRRGHHPAAAAARRQVMD